MNASHQLARGASSDGVACFQPDMSLYDAGTGAVGRT